MNPNPIPPITDKQTAPGFWETRAFVLLMVVVTIVPLLWPDVPPLTDLPGHMGRYKVQIDLENSPGLQRFYGFEWSLIGNLGVDLLVMPLAKLFGLELAVKLIVTAIPAMTVAGFLWVAREVHGRVPPTAFFALPFAYGHPFMFGFVNFALSMTFAFLAFGLWLRLARFGRFRLRAALFVPISCLVWVTHTFGWGTLGLLAFSAEAVRQHDKGRGLFASATHAAFHCLSMTLPLAAMLLWRSGQVGGVTADWFNWDMKAVWVLSTLRDRWYLFDIGALVIVGLVLLEALRHPKLEYSRNLAASALVLLAMFVLLPRIVFGSAYADMRLVPYVFAVALLAIRSRPGIGRIYAKALAIAGLVFFVGRTAGTAISFWLYDRTYDRELAALDHVPHGARLVTFVGEGCSVPWRMSRLHHIPALAIIRREAFSNDQWVMAGAQLLRVHYGEGGFFTRDPSQLVTSRKCRGEQYLPVEQALATLPRHAFDYVWMIQPPPYRAEFAKGLKPVWRAGTSILYKVER